MAVATITQPAPTEAELVAEVEGLVDARQRASETVPGWSSEPSPAQQILDDIFTLAVSHDTVCQWHEHYAYRYYGVSGIEPLPRTGFRTDDAPVGDYRSECVALCARLASAALRRIPEETVWQKAAADDWLFNLTDEELHDLLFPIFQEAGIPERFEVRPRHVVYDEATS